jgi:hypothetical protein
MDNGIWATWYDLPEDGREKYLDWLHGDYLPGLQAKPGIAWTAHYRSDGGGPDMQKVRDTQHTPGSPTVGERIWPPVA